MIYGERSEPIRQNGKFPKLNYFFAKNVTSVRVSHLDAAVLRPDQTSYQEEEIIVPVSLGVDTRFPSPRWKCRPVATPRAWRTGGARKALVVLQAETRLR